MQINLTEAEYGWLLMMSGYATGAAGASGDRELQKEFLRSANALARKSPSGFIPYDIPQNELEKMGDDAMSAVKCCFVTGEEQAVADAWIAVEEFVRAATQSISNCRLREAQAKYAGATHSQVD